MSELSCDTPKLLSGFKPQLAQVLWCHEIPAQRTPPAMSLITVPGKKDSSNDRWLENRLTDRQHRAWTPRVPGLGPSLGHPALQVPLGHRHTLRRVVGVLFEARHVLFLHLPHPPRAQVNRIARSHTARAHASDATSEQLTHSASACRARHGCPPPSAVRVRMRPCGPLSICLLLRAPGGPNVRTLNPITSPRVRGPVSLGLAPADSACALFCS